MRAIIIDDDNKAVADLTNHLTRYDDISVAGIANDAAHGIELMRLTEPDVVFLDIEMPKMSGLELMEELDRMGIWCHIVVCTAYSIYTLPAFRHDAFDFLTKPINATELDTVVGRLRKDISNPKRLHDYASSNGKEEDNEGDDEDGRPKVRKGYVLCYTNTEDFELVNVASICLFRYNSELRSWEAVAAGQKSPIKLKRDITKREITNIDDRFVQVSQKFIININCLLKVKDGHCVFNPPFEDIDYVKVGRFYKRKLVERFLAF